MREILFRGKRTDTGEWVIGQLARYNSRLDVANMVDEHEMLVPVHTKTVGQFTELSDRNGTKVFDGDILKFTDLNAEYEWIGRVEFGNPNEEYSWGFQLVFIKGEKPNTDILLWFDMEETGAFSEVIGNIYDNTELLK